MEKLRRIQGVLVLIFVLLLAAFIIYRIEWRKNQASASISASSATSSSRSFNLYSFKGVLSGLAEALTGKADPNIQDPGQIVPKSAPGAENTSNSKHNSFSFAVIGDTQAFEDMPPSGNLSKAVDSINKQNVDKVFVVGDLIFHCSEASTCQNSYGNWKSAMSPLLPITYEVQGNHDRTGSPLADSVWQKEFSNLPTNGPPGFANLVYSFDFQNSHFVVLDTEKPKTGEVDSKQLIWLKNDLATHQKQHTFVFYHEPAFVTGQKKNHGLAAHPKQRDKLWNILASNQVTAVFNGHEHIFTRKKIGNIYQFVVGDTDAPFDATPGSGLSDFSYKGNFYAIVTVSGGKINISLYSVDGNLINSFDF